VFAVELAMSFLVQLGCVSASNLDPLRSAAIALISHSFRAFDLTGDRLATVTPFLGRHLVVLAGSFGFQPGSIFGAERGQFLRPKHMNGGPGTAEASTPCDAWPRTVVPLQSLLLG
jgi:hypothetical protein